MKPFLRTNGLKLATFAGLLACCLSSAFAQEAAIRKNLPERLPNFPKIEEVSKTPMNGLYEVRVNGSELYYTDSEGNFLFQGELIDTKSRRSLTEDHQQTQRDGLCRLAAERRFCSSTRQRQAPTGGF